MHIKALTTVVRVSSSGVAENPKDLLVADDEAFYNATGCLRWVRILLDWPLPVCWYTQ